MLLVIINKIHINRNRLKINEIKTRFAVQSRINDEIARTQTHTDEKGWTLVARKYLHQYTYFVASFQHHRTSAARNTKTLFLFSCINNLYAIILSVRCSLFILFAISDNVNGFVIDFLMHIFHFVGFCCWKNFINMLCVSKKINNNLSTAYLKINQLCQSDVDSSYLFLVATAAVIYSLTFCCLDCFAPSVHPSRTKSASIQKIEVQTHEFKQITAHIRTDRAH